MKIEARISLSENEVRDAIAQYIMGAGHIQRVLGSYPTITSMLGAIDGARIGPIVLVVESMRELEKEL